MSGKRGLSDTENHEINFAEYLAEKLAGMTIDRLGKQKRLRGRSGYLCLSCGTAGYYAKRSEGFEGATFIDTPEDAPLDEILNTPVIITRLPDLRCANCKEEVLEVAGGTFVGKPDGCLVILLEVLGLIKPRPAPIQPAHLCPRCHTGYIHWKYIGIS